MKSPVGKVIGSFLVGGISLASHGYLPSAIDNIVQLVILQLALHYGITFAAPK